MSLFRPNYEAEGPGVRKDEKQPVGFIRFFKVIGHRFWQIIALNALYVFACLPIVTIGGATAGMTYVMRNFSQSKHAYFFSDFVEKGKENFLKGLAVVLIDAVVAFLTVYSYFFWSSSQLAVSGIVRTIALVCVFLVAYILVCTNFYVFPMMVSFDLPLKNILKNSLILGIYKLGQNLLMILFNGVITAACLLLFPLSMPFILFFSFTLCSLFNNFLVYPILVRYVASDSQPGQPQPEDQVFRDQP